jgi:hypothetical protein
MHAYSRRRYTVLFFSLLVTLGAGPSLEARFPRHDPLVVLLTVNLVAALASVAYEGNLRLLYALGGSFIVARIVLKVLDVPGLLAFSEFLWVTAIVLVLATAVRRALRRGVVNRERIMAALDAYLLAGFLFAVAYTVVDKFSPGSFAGASPLTLSDAIYFSFVTIATVGFGDIRPAGELARGLALVEGVSGQMYLAVLVARLVSLYSQQQEG